jgi:hypothetical protein
MAERLLRSFAQARSKARVRSKVQVPDRVQAGRRARDCSPPHMGLRATGRESTFRTPRSGADGDIRHRCAVSRNNRPTGRAGIDAVSRSRSSAADNLHRDRARKLRTPRRHSRGRHRDPASSRVRHCRGRGPASTDRPDSNRRPRRTSPARTPIRSRRSMPCIASDLDLLKSRPLNAPALRASTCRCLFRLGNIAPKRRLSKRNR